MRLLIIALACVLTSTASSEEYRCRFPATGSGTTLNVLSIDREKGTAILENSNHSAPVVFLAEDAEGEKGPSVTGFMFGNIYSISIAPSDGPEYHDAKGVIISNGKQIDVMESQPGICRHVP